MGKDRQWLMAYETLRDADLPNALRCLEFRPWGPTVPPPGLARLYLLLSTGKATSPRTWAHGGQAGKLRALMVVLVVLDLSPSMFCTIHTGKES